MSPGASPSAPRAVELGCAGAAVAAFWWLALRQLYLGELGPDEGFYALAARQAMRGQLPYADFAYMQAPLLPYINGVLLRIVGFGLFEQRAVNLAWDVATLAVMVGLAVRVARVRGLALLPLALLATSPWWVAFTVFGKTYAAAGFLVVVASAAVVAPGRRVTLALFVLAAPVALGVRASVAPALLVMWLHLLARERGRVRLGVAVGPWLVGGVLLAPFLLASPTGLWFFNVAVHAGSRLPRGALPWVETARELGVLWGALGLLAVLAVRARRWPSRPSRVLLTAGLTGALLQLLMPGGYGEYVAPFAPLVALGLALALADATWRRSRSLALLLALPLLHLVVSAPPAEETLAARLDEAAAALRAVTPAGEPVLTTMPIVAVDAGVEVLPRSVMGKFALTMLPPARAQALNLLTPDDVVALLESERAPVLVLADWPWLNTSYFNFGRVVPSHARTPEEDHARIFAAFYKRYVLVFRKRFVIAVPRARAAELGVVLGD